MLLVLAVPSSGGMLESNVEDARVLYTSLGSTASMWRLASAASSSREGPPTPPRVDAVIEKIIMNRVSHNSASILKDEMSQTERCL